MENPSSDIEYQPDRRRFALEADGETAVVSADLSEQNDGTTVVKFAHVFVPPSQRGKGTARQIVQHAFDHARREGWKVVPTCPYIVNQFLPRHPEYRDLLVG